MDKIPIPAEHYMGLGANIFAKVRTKCLEDDQADAITTLLMQSPFGEAITFLEDEAKLFEKIEEAKHALAAAAAEKEAKKSGKKSRKRGAAARHKKPAFSADDLVVVAFSKEAAATRRQEETKASDKAPVARDVAPVVAESSKQGVMREEEELQKMMEMLQIEDDNDQNDDDQDDDGHDGKYQDDNKQDDIDKDYDAQQIKDALNHDSSLPPNAIPDYIKTLIAQSRDRVAQSNTRYTEKKATMEQDYGQRAYDLEQRRRRVSRQLQTLSNVVTMIYDALHTYLWVDVRAIEEEIKTIKIDISVLNQRKKYDMEEVEHAQERTKLEWHLVLSGLLGVAKMLELELDVDFEEVISDRRGVWEE
ncbi:hypothetical protein EJ02DRAFT_421948 [Clathrospora elynae]|uniref:Uncharacterized protein n=1 Tax=Clathrospora elynae TaxID=706981 RepID=A0A6A5T0U2_9PLEO|nr:hypothetical protein EJ02DRAFT_421948 [Clathrospora elynae]